MANILLVEDDDLLRSMLTLLLTDAGHEVTEAPNGTQVCEMYQKEKFDLVITDMVMPDIEGTTVIMELRRLDAKVRIIAMSGGGRGNVENYLTIAQKLGAQIVLSKPFSNDEFIEAVRLTLES